MQKSRKFYLLFVAVLILGLSLTACGGKSKKKEKNAPPPASPIPTEEIEGIAEGTEPAVTLLAVTGDPAQGETLFESSGCPACHNVDTDQPKTGPSLKGIGSEAAEGQIDGVPALDYLHQSIVDPGAVIVEGFQNEMPSFKDTLTEGQIQDIIAYLVTLTD